MPWKVCKPMDERLKFVARLLDGEKMAGLCREFGISRKTGYKIIARYNKCGLEGLTDRPPCRDAIHFIIPARRNSASTRARARANISTHMSAAACSTRWRRCPPIMPCSR